MIVLLWFLLFEMSAGEEGLATNLVARRFSCKPERVVILKAVFLYSILDIVLSHSVPQISSMFHPVLKY